MPELPKGVVEVPTWVYWSAHGPMLYYTPLGNKAHDFMSFSFANNFQPDAALKDKVNKFNYDAYSGWVRFNTNWKKISNLGSGAYGNVVLAERTRNSPLWSPNDQGKLYAIKTAKFPWLTGHHSLYKEITNHTMAGKGQTYHLRGHCITMVEYDLADPWQPAWMAMEYVIGVDLKNVISHLGKNGWDRPIPAPCLLQWQKEFGSGLAWLHASGAYKPSMAHGDLWAANVMVDLSKPVPRGCYPSIKFNDFGGSEFADRKTKGSAEDVYDTQQSDIDCIGTILHSLAHGFYSYERDWKYHVASLEDIKRQHGTFYHPGSRRKTVRCQRNCPMETDTSLFLPDSSEWRRLMKKTMRCTRHDGRRGNEHMFDSIEPFRRTATELYNQYYHRWFKQDACDRFVGWLKSRVPR